MCRVCRFDAAVRLSLRLACPCLHRCLVLVACCACRAHANESKARQLQEKRRNEHVADAAAGAYRHANDIDIHVCMYDRWASTSPHDVVHPSPPPISLRPVSICHPCAWSDVTHAHAATETTTYTGTDCDTDIRCSDSAVTIGWHTFDRCTTEA